MFESPPATVPSTLHVYVRASPSGSVAMTVNATVAPASTVTGPSMGVLETIRGARFPTMVTGCVALEARLWLSVTVRFTV